MNDIEYLKKYYKGNLTQAIDRLKNNEPIQYIVGNVDFYGNIIKVNKNVLIPRFETEQLVSKTIDYINSYFNKKIDVVDIGTGSGCIAIALKKILDCNMDALDISDKALKIAKENAKLNNVDINFFKSDMLDNLNKKYDVIISNPPYISYDEDIMDIVKNNEPNIALYASNDGLYYYEKILKNAKKYLNKESIIAFEIGYLQGNSVKKIAKNYFPESNILIEKDLYKKDRFIFIFNK